jgi:hypothetical protein
MAHRLTSFDESSQGRTRKYPWAEWADGKPWEIRRGEDYDVATENMRVNFHMKGKQLGCKVRTRKFTDPDGEGLVFQFLGVKRGKGMASGTGADEPAEEALYEDCCHIYEKARREVTFTRSDGTKQKYAAIRFMGKMKRAHSERWLVAAVSSTVEHRTGGFGRLEAAERDDLMLENFILDAGKPYHHLFSPHTLQVAGDRMAEYYRRHPRRYGRPDASSS